MPEPVNIPGYDYIGTYDAQDACDHIRSEVIAGDHTTVSEVNTMVGGILSGAGAITWKLGATLAGGVVSIVGAGLAITPTACEFMEFIGDIREEHECKISIQVYIQDRSTRQRPYNISAVTPPSPIAITQKQNRAGVIIVPVCKDRSEIPIETIIRIAEPYVDELVTEVDQRTDQAVNGAEDLANTLGERLRDSLSTPPTFPGL